MAAVMERKKTGVGASAQPDVAADARRADEFRQQASAQLAAASADVARCEAECAAADEALDAQRLIKARAALDVARQVESVQQRVLDRAETQYRDALAAANRAKVNPLRERLIAEVRALDADLRRAEERNRKIAALQNEAVAIGRDANGLTGVVFVPFCEGSAGTGMSRLAVWRQHVAAQLGIEL